MQASVTIRGVELDIEFTAVEDPSVNYYSIEEWYVVGKSEQWHGALNLTDEEEEDLMGQLWQSYIDRED